MLSWIVKNWSTVEKFNRFTTLETLLETITNNSSEQGNFTFVEFREMPIFTGLCEWLRRHAEYFAQRAPVAEAMREQEMKVVQKWHSKVLTEGHRVQIHRG